MIPFRLGAIVVKRYGSGGESGEFAQIVSSCDAPSFQLRAPDGTTYHWRQDLTRDATPEESIAYWQQRAEIAERLLNKTIELQGKAIDRNFEVIERLNSKNED